MGSKRTYGPARYTVPGVTDEGGAVRTQLCDMLGCEFPIIAFSHCRDVIAAVVNAGGFGVFGASSFSADELDIELKWIDEHVRERNYGIDTLIPLKFAPPDGDSAESIPAAHKQFVADLLDRYGVPPLPEGDPSRARVGRGDTMVERATDLWDVGVAHSVKLYVSALGPPPPALVAKAHDTGASVAALVGKREHAQRQVAAGVDFLVAQGYEAGGHTGEIASMVLIPEVVDAVSPLPVVAAGGIASGRQIAAAMALGAVGVWTGSVWLTTQEAETHPVVKDKFLAATSSDTLRSRSSTGKLARQLRSSWTDEWESPANPDPLGMPLHGDLIGEAKVRIDRAAHQKGSGAEKLVNYFVGQVVGRMNAVKPARQVFGEMVEEYAEVVARFAALAATD
jgi:NAD(P)H-dependent flavin oxidoreductase YrpB (nitropropane dioxygenase family)